jgi:hypothetical protein
LFVRVYIPGSTPDALRVNADSHNHRWGTGSMLARETSGFARECYQQLWLMQPDRPLSGFCAGICADLGPKCLGGFPKTLRETAAEVRQLLKTDRKRNL